VVEGAERSVATRDAKPNDGRIQSAAAAAQSKGAGGFRTRPGVRRGCAASNLCGRDRKGEKGRRDVAPQPLKWRSARLVDQAFLSNPADEAKMLDPPFRKEAMRAVRFDTQDWLGRVRVQGP